MSLIEKLYPKDDEYVNKIWEQFIFFDPRCQYLGHKFVREALEGKDRSFFVDQIRNSFFPGLADDEVQEEYRKAMNKGIGAINKLCEAHILHPEIFKIDEVEAPLDLFDFIQSARYDWLVARNGKHKPDPKLLFLAYDRVRAVGLGQGITLLEESPEVINSLKHYVPVVKWFEKNLRCKQVEDWFKERLGLEDQETVDLGDITKAWNTSADVKIYGSDTSPVKLRLKIFDLDNRELRYGSLLMKMYLKGAYPQEIKDHVGVEFIVQNEDDRSRLVNYFQKILKTSGRMEAFKRREKGKQKQDNKLSSEEFCATKFIIRPPVRLEQPLPEFYGLGEHCYERVPIEVQILTLEDDRIRRENPDVRHEAYKRKQFLKLFPAIFPKKIYEPLLREV